MPRTRLLKAVALPLLVLAGSFSASAATEAVLYSFAATADGTGPDGALLADGHGNYFGTTFEGGANGVGTVFKLTRSGTQWYESILYSFTGTNGDGSYPSGSLARDEAGNLYGTTQYGGIDCSGDGSYTCGTVYRLAPKANGKWKETVLHAFRGGLTDGGYPTTGVALDAFGNLYGTTGFAGGFGTGTAFMLKRSPQGTYTETTLHSFGGDLWAPRSGVVLDNSGNLYGTVSSPSDNGNGAVYRLSPSAGGWDESFLFFFGSINTGWNLGLSNVIFDADGNLYGVSIFGGLYDNGTVFRLTPTLSGAWDEKVIYSFVGENELSPEPVGLTLGPGGNLYVTTGEGGLYNSACALDGCGSIFELTPTSSGPWKGNVLHNFAGGQDGATLTSPVIVDAAGDVFGTTYAGGGTSNAGTVFEISASLK